MEERFMLGIWNGQKRGISFASDLQNLSVIHKRDGYNQKLHFYFILTNIASIYIQKSKTRINAVVYMLFEKLRALL